MKKFTFFTICLLIFYKGFASNNSVSIKGIVENPKELKVSFRFWEEFKPNIYPSLVELEIIDNTFEITKEINAPAIVEFSYDRNYLYLYFEPGDQVTMSFDGMDFQASLKFEGEGAVHNNFIAEYERLFYPADFNMREFIKNSSAVEFKTYLDRNNREQADFIVKSKKMSKNFREYIEATSTYSYGTWLLRYVSFHISPYTRIQDTLELPDDYYNGLDNIALNKAELFYVPYYRSYIGSHGNLKFNEIIGKEENQNEENYWLYSIEIAKNSYEGEVRDVKWAQALFLMCMLGKREQCLSEFELFKAEVSNKEYILPIEEELAKQAPLTPGNKAPDFKLANLEGDMVSLSDFKGKVVYIDFWASWCGPCLQEAPAAAKLKEHYKDRDDLVFLYISIDHDENAWRNMIKEKELKGVHVLSKGWNSDVPNNYNVSAIPKYYIIGRDGNIFSDEAEKPSHKDVTAQIDEALGL